MELRAEIIALENKIYETKRELKEKIKEFVEEQVKLSPIQVGDIVLYNIREVGWVYDIIYNKYSEDKTGIKYCLKKLKKDGTKGNAPLNTYGTSLRNITKRSDR